MKGTTMKPTARYAGIFALLVSGCLRSHSGRGPDAEPVGPGPQYTAQGELQRPRGYQDWVLAGVSLGLEYSEEKPPEGPGSFHSVYLPPEAYRHYARTGKFPEKTMLVLEVREPGAREVIVKQGWFPGKLTGVAAAVKDRERFSEGWAYFEFGRDKEKAK